MYLWRCGAAVRGEHAGQVFSHGPCHLDDALIDPAGAGRARKATAGGWHDAGDYNKYIVNAGITVGTMLRAWEDFPSALSSLRLGTPPADPPLPDFLAEVRWEMDWVLSMQADDGSVHHKLSTLKFGGMILPEAERAERYLSPWSSSATASFTAMTAAAARHFQRHDRALSERCLGAARRSYAFLRAHPRDQRADLRAFDTGTYQSRDSDDRLWAAAELWEAAGDAEVLRDLETRIRAIDARFERDFDWGNVSNLGLTTYLFSARPGRDEALVARVRASLLAAAQEVVESAASHGYARPLGQRYYWGCNGGVARQAILLHAAQRLDPRPQYRQTILDALSHLFGRNVYGRSMVTGIGHRPPMNPHDRRSAADGVDAPWPGYLVGGPHSRATDWTDRQSDYRTNEIAINWNAALIYALAAAVEPHAGEKVRAGQ
jgi:endoglucanase